MENKYATYALISSLATIVLAIIGWINNGFILESLIFVMLKSISGSASLFLGIMGIKAYKKNKLIEGIDESWFSVIIGVLSLLSVST